MATYQIITDSCCDFTKEQYAQLDLIYVPLTLLYKGEIYESFTEAQQLKEFYDGIRAGEMPTTSAANPDNWARAMERVLKEGKDILCLVFTSGMSTTYQSAVIAAEELKEAYPERTIRVVDTLCAALGQGMLAYHACAKRDAGYSLDELTAWVEENKLKVCHEVTVDDLDHLKRGGRVSATTAFVGSMLNIKPMIRVDNNGKLETVGKVRGRKAAMDLLCKKFDQNAVDRDTVFIVHGDVPEDAAALEKTLKEKYGVKTVLINYLGGVIGSHTGPGVLAIFFMGNHR